MPHLNVDRNAPTAGSSYGKSKKRPPGAVIVITRVTIATYQDHSFGKWYGYLRDPTQSGAQRSNLIPLFNKILPGNLGGSIGAYTPLYEGRCVWPINLELRLIGRCQGTSDHFHYVIQYEIVTDPKLRARWGEA